MGAVVRAGAPDRRILLPESAADSRAVFPPFNPLPEDTDALVLFAKAPSPSALFATSFGASVCPTTPCSQLSLSSDSGSRRLRIPLARTWALPGC
jgi:hypothetical protein